MKKAYPRKLQPYRTLDGRSYTVYNALEEERYTGVKMNEDGTPFVEGQGVQGVPVEGDPSATPEVAAVLEAGVVESPAEPEVDAEAAADALGI